MKPEPPHHLQPEPDEYSPHASNLLVKILLIRTSHIYLDLPSIQFFC